MTNCVFDLKNLYRNTHNFSPFKYFTPLLVIFNTACGGGGGGGGATINPPKITAPPPGLVGTSEISNSPGLNLVAASHLYDSGARGRGFRIAVLDSGVEVTQQNIPIAMMGPPTSHSEMRMALDAGAVAYIPKNIGIKAFYSAMTLMAEGEIFLPADHGKHKSENSFLPENWLTGREQDMLAGLLDGKSNKEIARKHGLSEVTVKHHLKSLRGKLGAKNRTHAVCRAIELGIVPE